MCLSKPIHSQIATCRKPLEPRVMAYTLEKLCFTLWWWTKRRFLRVGNVQLWHQTFTPEVAYHIYLSSQFPVLEEAVVHVPEDPQSNVLRNKMNEEQLTTCLSNWWKFIFILLMNSSSRGTYIKFIFIFEAVALLKVL